MKAAILFITLLFPACFFAQHFYISGRILTVDSLPAENVLLETEIGPVTTDYKGQFHFELSKLPTAMTAKYHGYPDNDFYIDAPQAGLDSVFVELVLLPNVHDMDEVIVTNERFHWVYPEKDLNMIDCVILPEGFAFCGSENHRYYFRVIDEEGKVVAETRIRDHPRELFQDCEGEVHIRYDDSAYLVHWSPGKTEIFNAVSSRYFWEQIYPCEARFPDTHVMAYPGKIGYDKGVLFCYSENRLAKLHKLYQATSRKYLIRVEEYKMYLSRGGKDRKDKNDNRVSDLQKRVTAAHERQIYEEQLSDRNLESVALNVRDSLQIFDFKNDSILVYTPDMHFVRQYPMSLHVNKHFHGTVLTDLSHQRLFFVFSYDGMARLIEVCPDNGKVIGETKLSEHIYPYDLQVRGDFVYYLYHNHIDRSIAFLFRQRLNAPREPSDRSAK